MSVSKAQQNMTMVSAVSKFVNERTVQTIVTISSFTGTERFCFGTDVSTEKLLGNTDETICSAIEQGAILNTLLRKVSGKADLQ